jgi:type VI secretion system secreted protein Hcp
MAVLYSVSAGTPAASAAHAVLPNGPVAQPMQAMPDSDRVFLKMDGIEGDVTEKGQEGALEVLSFSFGGSQAGTQASGGGGGTGKVHMQDFSFTTKVSKATPGLFLRCANGEHIKSAVLTARKAGGGQQEYLVVTMKDVLISQYQMGGSSNSQIPLEEVKFSYGSIEVKYTPPSAGGPDAAPVSAFYDLTSERDG